MADEDKHHVVRTLKQEFDDNNSKLRQVRPLDAVMKCLGLASSHQCCSAPPNSSQRTALAAAATSS